MIRKATITLAIAAIASLPASTVLGSGYNCAGIDDDYYTDCAPRKKAVVAEKKQDPGEVLASVQDQMKSKFRFLMGNMPVSAPTSTPAGKSENDFTVSVSALPSPAVSAPTVTPVAISKEVSKSAPVNAQANGNVLGDMRKIPETSARDPGAANTKPIMNLVPVSKPTGSRKAADTTTSSLLHDFDYPWYVSLLKRKVSDNWVAPIGAKGSKARVVFTVNKTGEILEAKLDEKRSVGTSKFKNAALKAVQKSSPLPPMPEDFQGETAEFSVDLDGQKIKQGVRKGGAAPGNTLQKTKG